MKLHTGCVGSAVWIPARKLRKNKRWFGGDADTYYLNVLEPDDSREITARFKAFDCDNIYCDCDNFEVQMQTLNGWEPLANFNFSVRFTTEYDNKGFYIQVGIQ